MKAEITKNSISDVILDCISAELKIPKDQIDVNSEFINLGIDSIQGVLYCKTRNRL